MDYSVTDLLLVSSAIIMSVLLVKRHYGDVKPRMEPPIERAFELPTPMDDVEDPIEEEPTPSSSSRLRQSSLEMDMGDDDDGVRRSSRFVD